MTSCRRLDGVFLLVRLFSIKTRERERNEEKVVRARQARKVKSSVECVTGKSTSQLGSVKIRKSYLGFTHFRRELSFALADVFRFLCGALHKAGSCFPRSRLNRSASSRNIAVISRMISYNVADASHLIFRVAPHSQCARLHQGSLTSSHSRYIYRLIAFRRIHFI